VDHSAGSPHTKHEPCQFLIFAVFQGFRAKRPCRDILLRAKSWGFSPTNGVKIAKYAIDWENLLVAPGRWRGLYGRAKIEFNAEEAVIVLCGAAQFIGKAAVIHLDRPDIDDRCGEPFALK